ncbi:unnamed protein product, partial [Iphiclides podalirius]
MRGLFWKLCDFDSTLSFCNAPLVGGGGRESSLAPTHVVVASRNARTVTETGLLKADVGEENTPFGVLSTSPGCRNMQSVLPHRLKPPPPPPPPHPNQSPAVPRAMCVSNLLKRSRGQACSPGIIF